VCVCVSCVCVRVLYVSVGACSAKRPPRYLASTKAAPTGPDRRGRVLTGVCYIIVRVPLAPGILFNTICRQAGGLGGSVCGASLLSFRAQSQGLAN
jgi:hypothetical protein